MGKVLPFAVEGWARRDLRAIIERAAARVADIEVGLKIRRNDNYWRDKAQTRIDALEDDAATYGLFDHEVEELEALKALVAADAARRMA